MTYKIIRTATLVLALLMFPLMGNSQKTKVKVSKASYKISDPYKVVDANYKNYFYAKGDLMTVKIKGKKVTVQKFNTTKLTEKANNVYTDLPKGFVYEAMLEYNGKYLLFYSVWDKKGQHEQLFYREIDFEAGEMSAEEHTVIKTDGKVTGTFMSTYGGWSATVINKFSFFRSYNDQKLMITYRKKPEVKNDSRSNDIIGMYVFDEKMDNVWGDEIKMPYTEKKMDNLDYAIDKTGNAYILAKVFNDDSNAEKKRGEDRPNYHMEILRIPEGLKNVKSSDIDKVELKLADKFISSLLLFEGPDESLLCAGYYNNGKDFGAADGVIQFKIGKEGDIFDEKSYEFPLELINQFESAKTQKRNAKKDEKGRGRFDNLELNDLRVGSDGSLIFIGEVYYVHVVTTYSSKGGSTTTYYYHYDDILVTRIAPNGELDWMRKLPKSQVGANRGRSGMSYKYMWDEATQTHYFVFLDNFKNMNLDINKAPEVHQDGAGGYLTAYKVTDKDGTVGKVSILDTRDANGIKVSQFNVDRLVKSENGEFLMESYKKKKEDVLFKVKL